MPSKRRTKWQPRIEREEVPPELLEKFYAHKLACIEHYRNDPVEIVPNSLYPPGSNKSDLAHKRAHEDVPLTDEEMQIYGRLSHFALQDLNDADTYDRLEEWKEARARGEVYWVPGIPRTRPA